MGTKSKTRTSNTSNVIPPRFARLFRGSLSGQRIGPIGPSEGSSAQRQAREAKRARLDLARRRARSLGRFRR